MKRHRNTSPLWIVARFASPCACGVQINRGDRILYHPSTKTAQCEQCGRQHQRNLAADDMDVTTLWGGREYVS
jgi:hypothetical protein